MKAVLDQASKDQTARAAAEPLRRCLACGDEKPKSSLIRFVLDPENRVVPDLAGRLPGRGLWVSAERVALETAVRKNLFAKAAKAKTQADSELVSQVEKLLVRRCLELLGLARAARAVVTREPVVEEALAKGEIEAVLLASDAGSDIRKKLTRVERIFSEFSREELGEALGRDHLVAVGLKPNPLTQKLQEELARLRGVRGSHLFSTDDQRKQ